MSGAKFDAEARILEARRSELAALGCYVVRIEVPRIDALIIPTRSLAWSRSAEAKSKGGILLPEPPGLEVASEPRWGLTSMAFGVRLALDDFDLRAPSLTFRHPVSWDPLPYSHLPMGALIVDGRPMRVVLGDHPSTKAPFLCMRGVREYHEHPQHSGDDWLMYRGAINVFSLLTRVADCCCKNVRPTLLPEPKRIRLEWLQ